MPETNIILWTFENYKGDYLFPQTSLNQVFLSENSPTIRVAQGGVMKRAYVPHDITQVFGKFDNAHIPDPDEYALEDKYYNTSTNKVHTVKEVKQEDAPPGTQPLPDGTYGHRWTDGTELENDRILVDTSDNHVYHYHKAQGDSEAELYDVSGGGLIEGRDFDVLP